MKIHRNLFNKIISLDNLFLAWTEFRKDKQQKPDVQKFEFSLEQNIFQLHYELETKTYKHGPYLGFYISDPKLRHIHKATVRDRVLHHAIFQTLNPLFDPTFISASFSCRLNKGTHKGVIALEKMMRQESKNYTRTCWVLKCDVKKFFDSINHQVLLKLLGNKINDSDTMWLLKEIIGSFSTKKSDLFTQLGVPIGNLTSQLFANVYMNEFDQFMKHQLKVKHYARYTDDFVIVSTNRKYLSNLLTPIRLFLKNQLTLELHPSKISIRKCSYGVDFLGYTVLPHYRLVRTKTKQRIFKKVRRNRERLEAGLISQESFEQSLQSYFGVLKHCQGHKISQELFYIAF